MEFDVYFDHLVTHNKAFEYIKTTTKNSTMWLVRAGKLVVSLEILKPERTTNHERPTKGG